jgi:hypothetical protein
MFEKVPSCTLYFDAEPFFQRWFWLEARYYIFGT